MAAPSTNCITRLASRLFSSGSRGRHSAKASIVLGFVLALSPFIAAQPPS
jgi:hypothetical protein